MDKLIRLILCLLALSTLSIPAFPEGSKQIYIGTHNTQLFHCNDFINKCNDGNGDRSQFAVYGCNEPDRLYFVTNSPNEAVYMGFNGTPGGFNNKIIFRIKDMAGNIVYNERNLPTSGFGFINTIDQARVGPTQIYGSTSGGYDALSFHNPAGATFPATYYIEFNRVTNAGNPSTGSFNLGLIDITVTDTTTTPYLPIPGRLYSKTWQFTENGGSNCSATTYIYSNDSIITSCMFDDMSGGTWIQFCNQNGCGTSGNFTLDRNSVGYQVLLPQYKIFINPPDSILFPAASTLGQIIGTPWGERFCANGHIIFHVTVDKAGNTEVLLSFGAPYTPRTLAQAVVVGENLFEWDGLDGSGIPVPNNVNITFTTTYINGLTNLPFYDVEGNENGFTIGIVSPPGTTPFVFWDDTGVGGGSNLTGCQSPPGCHTWSGSFGGFGNLKTINTWWYNVSTSTVPAIITEFRAPQVLTFNQSPPQIFCAGTNSVYYSVIPDPNTTDYHWNYTGTGATIVHINPTDAFVSVSFAPNATSGSLEVYGTNVNCPGNGPVSSLPITIKPLPATNSPFSKSICSGFNVNMPLTSTPPGAVFNWVTPAPSCTPNISVCPAGSINSVLINDVLALNDLNPGTVTYHVTPVLNGCSGLMQDITVTVNPLPDINAVPANPAYCSGTTTNIALSSTVPNAVFSWTVDDNPAVTGDLPGPFISGIIDQVLTIIPGIYTAQIVTYHVTASVNTCTSPVTHIPVTVHPIPDVSNNPMSSGLCSGSTTTVPLLSNVTPGTTFTWTFTDNPDVAGETNSAGPTTTFVQTLTNLSFDPETVVYHITPTSQFGCIGLPEDFLVNIVTTPDIYFVPDAQSICSGLSCNIEIHSHNTSATFTWSTFPAPNPPSFFGWSNGAGNLIQQTLTNNLNTPQQVTYSVVPEAPGCPPGPAGNVTITVNPIPSITNITTTESICSSAYTNFVPVSSVNPGTTYQWNASLTSGMVNGFYSEGPSVLPPIHQQLTNTGFVPGIVTYQVIPTANGCTGISIPFIETVWPVPDVVFTPTSQSICSGGSTNINLSSNVLNTSFTWISTYGGGASGAPGGSGSVIQQQVTNAGPYPGWADYNVTPSANGCPGTSGAVMVAVNPNPVVTFITCFDAAVSINAQPVVLKGALPLGGTYAGNGVSGGIFDPGSAGPGTHTITYLYTNTWGCQGNAVQTISVVSPAPFTCGNAVTDLRDNQSYPTVQIGSQCWMAANLNYGNAISSAMMQRDNCLFEKYCFSDNPSNCISTGGLYQWEELMNYASVAGTQGFCPPEWHIPTEADWNTLFAFYISNGFAGSPLKYTGYSGFNAYLSGVRFNNTKWDFSNFAVMFWTSTAHGARKAWAHGMNEYNPSVSAYPSHKNNAFHVRCVKD